MVSLFDSIDKEEGMRAALNYLDVQYNPNQPTKWVKIRCPYKDNHAQGDRNPSAAVKLSDGGFTCHACGAHGDWARILLDLEGMKINEAVKLLGLERGETRNEVGDTTEGGLFLY